MREDDVMVEIKCTLCGKIQKANPDFLPRYMKCGHHGDHARVIESKGLKDEQQETNHHK